MNIAILPLLFICAITSIGESALKSYPIFFSAFIFAFLHSGLKPRKEIALPVIRFVFVAIIFAILNVEKSFDATSLMKLVLNFTFFLFAASYISRISLSKATNMMSVAAMLFLSLSFIQALYIVYANSLWLLPFSLENSTNSYAIQQGTIFFGDLNKNIWASKISIFLTVLCYCQYANRRPGPAFYIFLTLGLFNLLYVSSRTAQIAFLVFIASLFFYHYWVVKRKKGTLILLSIIVVPILLFLFQFVLRLDFTALSNFRPDEGENMGDGFLARVIIWAYVLKSVSLSDYLLGNGILSFNYYTGGIFTENNPHNIILSIVLDFGLLALILYTLMIYRIFPKGKNMLVFLGTFLVYANNQYLGYDSDLMIFFILVYLARMNSSYILDKKIQYRLQR